jgi:hypothetical protein
LLLEIARLPSILSLVLCCVGLSSMLGTLKPHSVQEPRLKLPRSYSPAKFSEPGRLQSTLTIRLVY